MTEGRTSVRDGLSDIEALRVTRAEYRTVLDHQIALLDDLDAKAMWVVRTAVFILGILVSGVGIAGRPVLSSLPPVVLASFGVGGLGLVVTLFVGVGVYTVSQPRFGRGDAHRREVTEMPYTEWEWLDLLLHDYGEWSGELDARTAENARQLFMAQTLLIGSLVILFVATMLLTLGAEFTLT